MKRKLHFVFVAFCWSVLAWAAWAAPAPQLKPKSIHTECRWHSLTVSDQNLNSSIFRNCKITASAWSRDNLKQISSLSSHWEHVDFSNSDLRGSTWVRSSCFACDFRGADLRHSTFFLSRMNGSVVNSKTQLPIDRAAALQLGFVYGLD